MKLVTPRRAAVAAVLLAVAGLSACDENLGPAPSSGGSSTPTPPAAVTPAGQSLVGVDPVNKTVWAPSYALDSNGNLQLTIVGQSDVAPAAVKGNVLKPHVTGTGHNLSLPGCDTPIAMTYDNNVAAFLIECEKSTSGQIYVQIANTEPVDQVAKISLNTITTTGLTYSGSWGGILFNPNTNQAVVAGTYYIGILDIPSIKGASFESDSVVSVTGTDSLSWNFNTQLLLVCTDGFDYTIDTSVRPLNPVAFTASNFGGGSLATTDGNGFDSTTNIALISDEVGVDYAYGVNFNGIFDAAGGTQPTTVAVQPVVGFGWIEPAGEGPGGQASVNTTTHQAVVADEFGPNFWLIQMPTAKVTGNLDNNGQPGSGTTADANSVYAVAGGLLPNVTFNGTSTPIGGRGDPSSLGVDQVNNIAYILADTDVGYHSWAGGTTPTLPLYLVAIDLSNPPQGGCTSGLQGNTANTNSGTPNGAVCSTTNTWTPKMSVFNLSCPAGDTC